MRMTDPATFFHNHPGAVEETLLPPSNSVDLPAMVHREFQCRLGSRSENIAELYHDNSKNIRSSTRQPFSDRKAFEALIKRQIETVYAPDPSRLGDVAKSAIVMRDKWAAEVPRCLHKLGLSRIRRFYSIDAYVLTESSLLRVLPGKSILWLERRLDEDDLAALHNSFFGPAEKEMKECPSIVFLVGIPWRQMMVYGPRGYRNMLVDLGAILADFDAATGAGEAVLIEQFYDNEIDRVLGFDGIVQSVQAIIGARHRPETTDRGVTDA